MTMLIGLVLLAAWAQLARGQLRLAPDQPRQKGSLAPRVIAPVDCSFVRPFVVSNESISVSDLLLARKTAVLLKYLPPGVESCPRTNDLSKYDKCVLQQLDAITPYLAKGIPSLKLPALDPLYLPSLTVDRNLEALKIKANMSQIRVYGATNFLVDDLRANPNDLTVSLKVQLPYVYVNGNYDVQGRLLLLPLSGSGSFGGNFTNTEVQVNAQGKENQDRNSVKRIEIDRLAAKIRVGDGNIKLKAPPSHTLAADAAATFFNSNPRLVLDIASPIIEDTAATVSRALVARALSVLTKDDLVPSP